MVNKRRFDVTIVVGAIGLALLLVACPQPTIEERFLSSDAEIEAVSISGISAEIGTPGLAWNSAGLVTGRIVLPPSLAADAEVEVTRNDPQQVVHYAVVSGDNYPFFAMDPAMSFEDGDFLHLRVFSANRDTERHYRIEVLVLENNAQLARLEVMGESVDFGSAFTDAAATVPWDDEEEYPARGELILSRADAATPTTFVTTVGRNVDVSFALNDGAFGAPAPVILNNGDFVRFRLVSEDGETTLYYRINITVVDSDWSLATVRIGEHVFEVGPPALTAAAAASSNLRIASVDPIDFDADFADLPVVVTTTLPTTTVAFAVTTTATGTPMNFSETPPAFSTGTGADARWLVVRVRAEDMSFRFYRFGFAFAVGRSGNAITGLQFVQGGVTRIAHNVGPASPTVAAAVAIPAAQHGQVATGGWGALSVITPLGLSEGATAAWAVSTAAATPGAGAFGTGNLTTAAGTGFPAVPVNNITVRITAENGDAAYYRFVVRNSVAGGNTLSVINVSGVTVGGNGTPVTTGAVPSVAGNRSLTASEAVNAELTVTHVAWSTASFAIGTADAVPEGDAWSTPLRNISTAAAATTLGTVTFNHGDNIFIRIQGENMGAVNTYRIVVGIGTDTSLTLSIGEVASTGTPTAATSWEDTTVAGSVVLHRYLFDSAATGGPLTLPITATIAEGATAQYAIVLAGEWPPADIVTWVPITTPASFSGGESLIVRVTSPLSDGGIPRAVTYRRFVVAVN